MPCGVLLIVNCALDSSYGNRHLLGEMYRGRFDRLVFTVSTSCPVDPQFPTIAQMWDPPPTSRCVCENAELGEHNALRHSFHPRLIAAAALAAEFEFVLFTEDDCVLSPHCDADWVVDRCRGWDALSPQIRPCFRDDRDWIWTQHATGYPAFDAASDCLDHSRLAVNWARYGSPAAPLPEPPSMFYGFCDWFVVRNRLLPQLIRDLHVLREVWHEAAIPTALLHNTWRIGVSNGLPLWGADRERPLAELISWLNQHDFVHAIKLSRYSREEVLSAYRGASHAACQRDR